ncbi:MAG TPA: helix-turn-helix transcriptional regulator [Candidatus Angelobacter sp.]|nr:helix-turn-helix transcriptional regulator [Candidatus Angelobacter sp.]
MPDHAGSGKQFTAYLHDCQNAKYLANFALFFDLLASGMLNWPGGRMHKNKNDFNNLWVARRRLRMSQKQVARLLGHASTTMLSKYERGRRPPPFEIAIKLTIIYKMNIEELFPQLYRELKTEIVLAQN